MKNFSKFTKYTIGLYTLILSIVMFMPINDTSIGVKSIAMNQHVSMLNCENSNCHSENIRNVQFTPIDPTDTITLVSAVKTPVGVTMSLDELIVSMSNDVDGNIISEAHEDYGGYTNDMPISKSIKGCDNKVPI